MLICLLLPSLSRFMVLLDLDITVVWEFVRGHLLVAGEEDCIVDLVEGCGGVMNLRKLLQIIRRNSRGEGSKVVVSMAAEACCIIIVRWVVGILRRYPLDFHILGRVGNMIKWISAMHFRVAVRSLPDSPVRSLIDRSVLWIAALSLEDEFLNGGVAFVEILLVNFLHVGTSVDLQALYKKLNDFILRRVAKTVVQVVQSRSLLNGLFKDSWSGCCGAWEVLGYRMVETMAWWESEVLSSDSPSKLTFHLGGCGVRTMDGWWCVKKKFRRVDEADEAAHINNSYFAQPYSLTNSPLQPPLSQKWLQSNARQFCQPRLYQSSKTSIIPHLTTFHMDVC